MTKHRFKHFTESIYYDIEQTSRLLRKLSNQLFEVFKLSITCDEYLALDTISCNAGICQRELAKLILKDRANTGRILDSLEEKELITRFIDTKNNRLVKKMGITEAGYNMLREINKKVESHFKATHRSFTEEDVDVLQGLLRQFQVHLSEIVIMNI